MPNDVFLPVPRIPESHADRQMPDPFLLDSLVPKSGDVIRAVEVLRAEVEAAVRDVKANRPGYAADGWDAALAADGDAVLSGRHPKRWAAEVLLDTDHARWAKASALARTYSARVAEIRATVPVADLLAAITARRHELRDSFAGWAENAWLAVQDGTKAAAHSALEECQGILDEGRELDAVMAWLARGTGAQPTVGSYGPEALGFWYAARAVLEKTQYVVPPQGVEWPAGFNGSGHLVSGVVMKGHGTGRNKYGTDVGVTVLEPSPTK